MSILEGLYMGNISFDSGRHAPDSPFVKAAQRKIESMEKLTATLDERQKELFKQYCEAEGEIDGIMRYDTFTRALSFGILLMIEIFSEGDSC